MMIRQRVHWAGVLGVLFVAVTFVACSQESDKQTTAKAEAKQAKAMKVEPKPAAKPVDPIQVKIERAMSAGPEQISKDAMIMDVDGTMLREGSNGWMCMPSVTPNDKVPMCNDATWTALMQAFAAGKPFKADRVGVSYMFQGDIPVNNDDPTDTTRDPGEPWVQEGPHIMIVVPDKSALEGLPTDPNAGGPYVMWKDTPYAHIMVPIAARP